MQPNQTSIQVVGGDIFQQRAQVLVNPANNTLQHGGGLAQQFLTLGGVNFARSSNALISSVGFVPTGTSAFSDPGDLRALGCQLVIHTVGPRATESGVASKLKSCVKTALDIVSRFGFASVAIPTISSGIYGVPIDVVAKNIIQSAFKWIRMHPNSSVSQILFCSQDYNQILALNQYLQLSQQQRQQRQVQLQLSQVQPQSVQQTQLVQQPKVVLIDGMYYRLDLEGNLILRSDVAYYFADSTGDAMMEYSDSDGDIIMGE